MVSDSRLSDASLDLFLSELFAVEVLHHEFLVLLSNVLDHIIVILLSDLLHVLRDILNLDISTKVVCINVSLHFNKVNDTLEIVFCTDRELNRNGITLESILHHVNNTIEVGTHDVHLIYISHTGYLVVISLTPNGLRLGLNTALSTENCYRAIEYTE